MSERENLELESRRLQVETQRMIVQSMRDTAEINRKNLEMLSKPAWRSAEYFWLPLAIGSAMALIPMAVVFLLHKMS
ncbi:hypothetical protein [Pseudomonas oryzihabitans]|uniref:Uncharacterized protein n=1 Tax=Pseudomonas oryzihabitans TaxID=47885 RepID=A0A1G5PDV9_9PSED|nr:hypothetical protein [Pseudomonas psychrotolerans]NMY91846.1 hypothetical protein [Pseudomonas psychrotolerans]NMY91941.1 hypothetical protein [Pseudomonas psychrotolerans]SCZ47706.1 hypothetical protein SAMN05216279_115104 [Pseudomonas psychrotolerans]